MFSGGNFEELVKNGKKVARFVSFYEGTKVACIGPEVSITLNLFTEHDLDGVTLDLKDLSKIMATWKNFQIIKEDETGRILMLHENSMKVLKNVTLSVPDREDIPEVKDPCYLLLTWFESYKSMASFYDINEKIDFMNGVNFYDNFDLMATDGKKMFVHRTDAEEGSNKYPQVIPYNSVLDKIKPEQCFLTADGLWLMVDSFIYFVRKIDLGRFGMVDYTRIIPDHKTLTNAYFDCKLGEDFSKALKETQKFMKMDNIPCMLIDNEGLGYKSMAAESLATGPFVFKNKISIEVETEENFLININPSYLEALLKATNLSGKEIKFKIRRKEPTTVVWEDEKDFCIMMGRSLS